jgi:hypothetical protein
MYQTLHKYAISTRRYVFYSVSLKMYAVSSVSGGRGEDVYREGGGQGRRGEERGGGGKRRPLTTSAESAPKIRLNYL